MIYSEVHVIFGFDLIRPSVGAASVCLLSMMFLLGASRLGSLTSLYLRFTFLFHLTSGVTGSAALKHGFLSYRLLRMNVQGCHNILAICSHIEFEKMTASGPVHHPLKTYTFFLIIIVSFIIISSPRSVTNSGSAWGYPPPPRLAKNTPPPFRRSLDAGSLIPKCHS